ncbi:hypothetical protein SERLA73DRAFT_107511 [Serpula lacrymans var. lacrymans S7.3]|uniref:Uncharacterized protein n=2 Tax=Serpula lacrymans var. lacrymans TaxID=341189 RepID=F8PUA2_SERL3|nr:uncharacterized protein SERLADRAFT_361331 [Serpula lacrymans var. lacrymans S7.9]EGO00415.1 hypothetical protein SERLA73DRAFT_107511 [Serpula lacrymans var. lacrymans S7.3]EGO25973.1 hypothetical protein SERLADRAFT_361331 [Serpula lacrymans var. lacrymans S7.9]
MLSTGHDKIESMIKSNRQAIRNEMKILVLDTEEPRGSTLHWLKSTEVLFRGGYSNAERNSFKQIVISKTIRCMRNIVEAMPQLDIPLSRRNDPFRSVILNLPPGLRGDEFPQGVVHALLSLWRDPGVKEAARRSEEFQLSDHAAYFLNAIDRISAPGYMPTDQDILRAGSKDTGVDEVVMQVGELVYKFVQVNVPAEDRKKWISCFSEVKVLIYVVDLSQYDRMSLADENMTYIQHTLETFESICNAQWFRQTPIVLLMDKIDVFSEKLEQLPLNQYFPGYTGCNYDTACEFMLRLFVSLNRNPSRQVYSHFVSTTDMQQMKFILSAIQDISLNAIHRRGSY